MIQEKDIQNILESSKKEIEAALIEKVKTEIINSYYWTVSEKVGKITAEFIENDMKDDIKQLLDEAKPLILEQIKNGIIEVAGKLSVVMVEKAAKNLQGYNKDSIVKSLFQ